MDCVVTTVSEGTYRFASETTGPCDSDVLLQVVDAGNDRISFDADQSSSENICAEIKAFLPAGDYRICVNARQGSLPDLVLVGEDAEDDGSHRYFNNVSNFLDPTYRAPTFSCAFESDNPVGFHLYEITAPLDASADLEIDAQSISVFGEPQCRTDTGVVLILYSGGFDPAAPTANCEIEDDGAGFGECPSITRTLAAGETVQLAIIADGPPGTTQANYTLDINSSTVGLRIVRAEDGP